MTYIPDWVVKEAKILARGIVSALVAGSIYGLAHYFGLPLPQNFALPTMAVAGWAAIKMYLVHAVA